MIVQLTVSHVSSDSASAIPRLFRLYECSFVHLLFGRPAFPLSFGMYSYTNLGVRVSFILDKYRVHLQGLFFSNVYKALSIVIRPFWITIPRLLALVTGLISIMCLRMSKKIHLAKVELCLVRASKYYFFSVVSDRSYA